MHRIMTNMIYIFRNIVGINVNDDDHIDKPVTKKQK
jgi:hypothetical protein